jgi:hypothetical protein
MGLPVREPCVLCNHTASRTIDRPTRVNFVHLMHESCAREAASDGRYV